MTFIAGRVQRILRRPYIERYNLTDSNYERCDVSYQKYSQVFGVETRYIVSVENWIILSKKLISKIPNSNI